MTTRIQNFYIDKPAAMTSDFDMGMSRLNYVYRMFSAVVINKQKSKEVNHPTSIFHKLFVPKIMVSFQRALV